MFVYLIKNEDGKYKIGLTKRTVEERIEELQTGSPYLLEVVEVFKTNNASRLEVLLHRMFASKKMVGEWFDLSEEDVLGFKNICSKIDEGLEFIRNNKILPDDIINKIK